MSSELTKEKILQQLAEQESDLFVPGISVLPEQFEDVNQLPVAAALPGNLQNIESGGFKLPQFNDQEFQLLIDDLKETPFVEQFNMPINSALARYLADTVGQQSPGTTYQTLQKGTAPILDMYPEFADIPLSQRDPLSDEEIVGLLARDSDGRPIGPGTVSKAFRYELLPTAASALGFKQGLQFGSGLVSGVSPINPGGFLIRTGVPLITGLSGMLLYDFLGRTANEALTEEKPPMQPGTKAPYFATQLLLGTGIYGPMGTLIPQNINLGSTLALQALEEGIKLPWAVRTTQSLEKALGKTGEFYRKEPGKAATVEGATGIAVAGTVAPLMDIAPDEQLLQLGVGFGAGTSAALITNTGLNIVLPGLKYATQGLKKGFTLARSPEARSELRKQTLGIGERISGSVKAKREIEISKYLNKLLTTFEEDPKEAIRQLEELDLDGFLIDPTTQEKLRIDAGTRIGSPALIALRKSVEKYSGKALEKGALNKAELALLNAVRLMFASGDPRAAQEASVVSKFIFEASIDKEVQAALTKYKNAYETLKKGQDDPLEIDKLGNDILDLLSTKLEQYRVNERALYKKITPDLKIISFMDEAGDETNIPRFIQTYRAFTQGFAPEAIGEIDDALGIAFTTYRKRIERELGIDGSGITTASVPDQPVADLGKELTLKNVQLPEGFRVFQRNVEVVGEAGKVRTTSVVDPNGNRIDLVRDPDNKVSPYNPDIIDGVTDDISKNDTSFGSIGNTLADAVEDAANRMSKGRVRFQPRTAAPAAATDGDTPGIIPSELMSMYGSVLETGKQKQAAAQTGAGKGSKRVSGLAFRIARAMQEDLDSIPTGRNQDYDVARSYSRALNDSFVRTFGGKLLNVRPTSEKMFLPEQIRNEYMKADGAYLRQKQIENYVKFEVEQDLTNLLELELRDQGREVLNKINKAAFDEDRQVLNLDKLRVFFTTEKENLKNFPQAKTAIENALQTGTDYRSLFDLAIRQAKVEQGVINPDGSVSQAALQKWLDRPRTQALFQFFPELKKDFSNFTIAKELLDENSEIANQLRKKLNEEFSVFALLPDNTTRPGQKIKDALKDGQPNPWQNLNALWKAVEEAPPQWSSVADPTDPSSFRRSFSKEDAEEGFRTMLFDSVMESAGVNSDGITNATTLYTKLFQPLPGVVGNDSNLTLSQWMISKNLTDANTMEKAKRILAKVVEMENLAFAGKEADLEGFLNQLPASAKVIAAALGSKAGTSIQKMLPGETGTASLILAGRGATEGVALLEKIQKSVPEGFKMDMLQELLFDAEGLARVLRLTKPNGNQKSLIDAVMTFLIRQGIATPKRALPLIQATGSGALQEESLEEPAPTPEPQAAVQEPQQNLMAQRFARPTPTVIQPRQQPVAQAPAPRPPAPSQGQANPAQRQRLAQLFPNDPLAQAAGPGGGIGSLFS